VTSSWFFIPQPYLTSNTSAVLLRSKQSIHTWGSRSSADETFWMLRLDDRQITAYMSEERSAAIFRTKEFKFSLFHS